MPSYPHFLFMFLLPIFCSLVGCRNLNTPERANALMTDGWTGPTPQASKTGEKPLYCYRTLGKLDCYEYRQKGWDNRLVAFYEPPPAPFPVFKAPEKH